MPRRQAKQKQRRSSLASWVPPATVWVPVAAAAALAVGQTVHNSKLVRERVKALRTQWFKMPALRRLYILYTVDYAPKYRYFVEATEEEACRAAFTKIGQMRLTEGEAQLKDHANRLYKPVDDHEFYSNPFKLPPAWLRHFRSKLTSQSEPTDVPREYQIKLLQRVLRNVTVETVSSDSLKRGALYAARAHFIYGNSPITQPERLMPALLKLNSGHFMQIYNTVQVKKLVWAEDSPKPGHRVRNDYDDDGYDVSRFIRRSKYGETLIYMT
jgi:hypothetical protein